MSGQPFIVVDDVVAFAANRGIEIIKSAAYGWTYGGAIDLKPIMDDERWPVVAEAFETVLNLEPRRLVLALLIARDHYADELVVDGCCGGQGPLANIGPISFEEYREIAASHQRQMELLRSQKEARLETLAGRRAQFDTRRAMLISQMLDSGTPYICVHPGCGVIERLTVDHIIPISRGGTDDLDNLQFMCLPHNSAKGNRI